MAKKINFDTKNFILREEFLKIFPPELIKEYRAFVFDENEREIKMAAVDLKNSELKNYVKENFKKKVEWFLASEEDIKNILENHKPNIFAEVKILAETASEANDNVTRIVDIIFRQAIERKASDIHIEPLRKETAVRFRVDGVLHRIFTLPKSIHQAIIARLKIMANLKIDEYRRPQDGRIEPEEFPTVSLRVSVMPTLFGEKIALRVLDEASKSVSIDELGLSQKQKEIILENIEKPFGMIVVSGPTGSGKTTTLYSILQLLRKEGVNISTLEDPVEYTLTGVNQVQIDPRFGITFAAGLRALLRQDPDIIMVGEIRDSETAIMAANAAMTGHLVFTTIHTNDASSVFARMLEMKVEDFVLASTINLVIAQRLVRRICQNCVTEKKLEPVILKKIKERKDVLEALEQREKGLSKKIDQLKFKVGQGCEKCLFTGYSGRIGIFEILTPTKEIHDAILVHSPTEKIEEIAKRQGFESMVSDGIKKIFDGITTFEEVLRVTKKT